MGVWIAEDIREQARALLIADEDWNFDEGDDDLYLQEVLWYAVATTYEVEIVGDQWFNFEITSWNFDDEGTPERTREASWECNTVFDGLCQAYVWMRT